MEWKAEVRVILLRDLEYALKVFDDEGRLTAVGCYRERGTVKNPGEVVWTHGVPLFGQPGRKEKRALAQFFEKTFYDWLQREGTGRSMVSVTPTPARNGIVFLTASCGEDKLEAVN